MKRRARALQEDTGWKYVECLRCVRAMSEDDIDALIEQRKRSAGSQESGKDVSSVAPPGSNIHGGKDG